MSPFSLAGGCVELGIIPPPDNGGGLPDGGDGNGNGGPSDVAPTVRLSVSNLTPQVNEQVTLRCIPTNDAPGPILFDFQTSGLASARLVENTEQGTATFIVDESDIGVATSVTCSATNDFGEGPRSTAQIVVATSSEPPLGLP